jgi:Ca2+-transporting ATPase
VDSQYGAEGGYIGAELFEGQVSNKNPIGLTSAEAAKRLNDFGFNELPSAKPKSIWGIALEVIKEPMFLLLISCATLYMILGDYREGIILLSTISVIIGITFYQYRKTERALETLKNLSSPRALVVRDGIEQRIAGRDVVPGDLIILHEGDRVPADAELVEVSNVLIDESILTGESVPVNKILDAKAAASVFSGTLVLAGKGLAKATSTGQKTELGKIGVSLRSIEELDTPLQQEMKVMVRNFAMAGVAITILVIAMFYFTRGQLIQAILTGLSAAMAILPEEFPVVLTVFLALGAWGLSKRNVLTRKPSAIETLGSATVLCSDKTGTITQNKMEVRVLCVSNSIVDKPDFVLQAEIVSPIILAGAHACVPDSHDPMEKAMIDLAVSLRMKDPIKVIKEYAFTRERMTMTRVLRDEKAMQTIAYCKGAPEFVFKLCGLQDTDIQSNTELVHKLAARGLRVLAVAQTRVNENTLPDDQTGFQFHYIGLVGLADPVRLEVPQAVRECLAAGVKVIMITGDYPETARSIAHEIGLPDVKIISGPELEVLSEAALRKEISNVNVFARVLPEQKLRIVNALKANNEIVAMTGDGVNDAPALKAADIGVAMGLKGTDVSREAASLVLLDDNFASIVMAIRQGRKIFDNLQKAMAYILAIHIPIIGLTLIPAFVSTLPVLLLPLHIVFMELIIDPACSVAFESEGEEKGIMDRPPRSPNVKFFGTGKILNSLFQGSMLLLMVIGVYWLSIWEGHTEGEVRAIAFSALIIGNIFLILTNLSKTRSVLFVLTEKNPPLKFILAGAMVILLTILHVPALLEIFSFEFPGYQHFISSLIGAFLVLFVLETAKYFKRNRAQMG